MGKKQPLPGSPTGSLLFWTQETFDLLKKHLKDEVILDPTQFDRVERAGAVYYRLRSLSGESGRSPLANGRFMPYIGGPDLDRLYISPGTIRYVEQAHDPANSDGGDSKIPNKSIFPIFPTLDGVPITSEDAFFTPGDSCRLWLICQRTMCSSDGDIDSGSEPADPERIVMTDIGDKPSYNKENEDGTLIAELFFDSIDGGGKAIRDLDSWYIGSDHAQFYSCDDEEGGDVSGSWPSGAVSNDSSNDTPPTSSDSGKNPDPPHDCKMTMQLEWLNRVSCFDPVSLSGKNKCTPKYYVFHFNCIFRLKDPYLKKCPAWAYELTFPGAKRPRLVKKHSGGSFPQEVRFDFEFDHPPSCQNLVIQWRAIGAPRSTLGGESETNCCAPGIISGSWPEEGQHFKLPPVCGCICSSPGDVDGDGIPNEDDPDFPHPTP